MTSLRRFGWLWLALVVAVLNAGAPVLSYAAMAGNGGPTQVICTAAGMQTVVVDADGRVHPAGAQPSHAEHCSLCSMPAPPPVHASVHAKPQRVACRMVRVDRTGLPAGSAVVTPPSTGPPARG